MSSPAAVERCWQQLRSSYEGFWATWLMHVGRELGLFARLLQQPDQTSEALAESLGFEAPYVEVWCQAAFRYDYLEESSGGWRVAEGWDELLNGSAAWSTTWVQLSNRVYETLEAVFRGRALPESSLNLRLHLAEGLRASYRWLWLMWAPQVPELLAKLQGGKRLIEYGCGYGLGLELLRQHYPQMELTGLEWDYDCAREAERVTRAVVVVGQPEESSYRNRFDLAVFHRALALCEQPQEALRRACAALRRDGLLVIVSESDLSGDTPMSRQTQRLRIGERFFFQMFHASDALRSVPLAQIEAWLQGFGMKTVRRDASPLGGSPALVMSKG